jgi:hypothetical protein
LFSDNANYLYTEKWLDVVLNEKGEMKSEIKITGLIKSGCQLIAIKQGRKDS